MGRVFNLAAEQRELIAVWQMKRLGVTQSQVNVAVRGWRRVFRGVYALSDLDQLGWFRAATLIAPDAVLSHGSALALLDLHDELPTELHVTLPKRSGPAKREGLVIHRPRKPVEWGHSQGIPVTSPTQTLKDTNLPPAELFHALDRADNLGYDTTLPLSATTTLQQATQGRTKSVAEAAFILLCHDHGIDPPRVNHHLNGFETDFHWPLEKLVVEVDGFEFHKERRQFEEDRRRGMIHNTKGYTVTRVSALQVIHEPGLVAAAVAERLSAQRPRRSKRRSKQPK